MTILNDKVGDTADEKFQAREITLPDGRYMVFYTFPAELSPDVVAKPSADTEEKGSEDV